MTNPLVDSHLVVELFSRFRLNVKQRTYSSGACATEYFRGSHSMFRVQGCHRKFGAVVKLLNYLNVEALVNIRSL